MISRRSFIDKSTRAVGSLLVPSLVSCNSGAMITGGIQTPNFALGHKLRELKDIRPVEFYKHDVVVVGGGISGLSAARWLAKNNVDFRLLELEKETGGNSRSGQNEVSAFPLGAHYLPLPNTSNKYLLDFLEEAKVITGYQNELPVYQDYHLCFDPKERLFINHHWQEGLIPHEGVPKDGRDEIQQFLNLMQKFKETIGADGRYAFELPVDESSQDPQYTRLDAMTLAEFMRQEGFTSAHLFWYVNYCCLDDYGSSTEETSAWAGIHYFACRRGKAANASYDDVLTWPEGNNFLVKALAENVKPFVQSETLVMKVEVNGQACLIDYFDANKNLMARIEAKAVIMATPQFVNQYLLTKKRDLDVSKFQYAPWLVANLTVNGTLDERRGEPLSWDNVIYGSQSLGYVHAGHQQLSIPNGKSVITYYRALTGADLISQRQSMQQTTWETWSESIFSDLAPAHPKLKLNTVALDVYLWGHGMIKPGAGFIWGEDRKKSQQPIHNMIYFAHSDVGGVSVFEEAFSHGLSAAQSILKKV